MHSYLKFCLSILAILLYSCDNNDAPETQISNSIISGTGSLIFSNYPAIEDSPMNIFYHIPENPNTQTPMLFVLHGSGRNAAEYRDALIEKSESLNFIVVSPEFTDTDFPGGDGYNLSNIFNDGDAPSESSLNPESEWTISIIDPLFDFMKEMTDNKTITFDLFGHSAGGQVAHRYLLFKPNGKINRVISSAAGWYTMPDISVLFPYGLSQGPFEFSSFVLEELFYKKLHILIGTNDNDPNYPGLRHTDEAEIQGTQRLERAAYFFNESMEIANELNTPFNWQYQTVPNVGHQYVLMSQVAAELLYD